MCCWNTILIASAEMWRFLARRELAGQVTSITCDSWAVAEAKCLTTGQGVNERGVLGGREIRPALYPALLQP